MLRCLGDREVLGSGDMVTSHQLACVPSPTDAAELQVALALLGCKINGKLLRQITNVSSVNFVVRGHNAIREFSQSYFKLLQF